MEKLQLNRQDCSIHEPNPVPSVRNGRSRFKESVPLSIFSQVLTGGKLNYNNLKYSD